jgi:hypothetical protein
MEFLPGRMGDSAHHIRRQIALNRRRYQRLPHSAKRIDDLDAARNSAARMDTTSRAGLAVTGCRICLWPGVIAILIATMARRREASATDRSRR